MKTSDNGLDLIKSFEGLRLEAYLDSVGVLTIGYGHISKVSAGDTCTEEQADEWLKSDVERAELCIENSVKVPLTQNQFDALVSFVFNLGCFALGKSTLLRKLNAGDDMAAADEFLNWCHAGGRRIDGLVRRRKEEMELFNALA